LIHALKLNSNEKMKMIKSSLARRGERDGAMVLLVGLKKHGGSFGRNFEIISVWS
jgi:hypothetical protein